MRQISLTVLTSEDRIFLFGISDFVVHIFFKNLAYG